MARFSEAIRTIYRDRRARVGAAVALSATALMAVGLMAVVVATKPQPAIADMAEHARLMIVAEPATAEATPEPQGRLATLDAEQLDATNRPINPLDPALQAILEQERQEQTQAAADQRAFDARMKADMAGAQPDADDGAGEAPERTQGSTSNSESTADQG